MTKVLYVQGHETQRDILEQLLELCSEADIPIIVISAWGSAKHKEQALKAGADAHFTKPVPIAELIAAINWHLASRPVTRAALLLAHGPREREGVDC